MPIPLFLSEGRLPEGDHLVTLEELRESFLVTGPPNRSLTWDTEWRRWLVDQLSILVRQLWSVGITDIFIDGSFVEDKDHPNDIDGYFECRFEQVVSGDLVKALNAIDPYKIWTWNSTTRRSHPDVSHRQLPMWHQYRVELYPHYGQGSGIIDRFGHELTFPAAFRKTRSGRKSRGIVKIGGNP